MRRLSAPQISGILSVVAALLVGATAFYLEPQLGIWRFPFYLGAILALLGPLAPLYRRITARWNWFLRRHGSSDGPGGQDPGDSGLLPEEFTALLDERLREIERREREFADRVATQQQWLEFPPTLDLASGSTPDTDALDRDHRLAKLLELRTQVLFEKIQANEYSPEGVFQPMLVRDDIYSLVNEIAGLYGGDPENPLSGVSSERVLRAGSRCCLKFLVELEKLPLDVRSYDLAAIYGYVRQAVAAYGIYRSARPYMPWLRGAYYGTWVAMGANPLALGAWWFASSLSQKGASTLATKIANRWALNFLHDIVRVIGYEVASVYDENLRYRDPNWCFAAELTEILRRFPRSATSLQRALSLIGALQLRNEYDRSYFFRCIAEGKSADLNRIRASNLAPEQRRDLAERLEAFLKSYVTDETGKATERWRAGVEDRLDITLKIDGAVPVRSEHEQRRDAVRSLAGYLVEIKQTEPNALQPVLEQTGLVSNMPKEELPDLWRWLTGAAPFFFEMPELAPAGSVAKEFLRDLANLAVRVTPRYSVADEVVVSAAVRLRSDARQMKALLDREYVDEVARLLPQQAPIRRLPPEVARAVLDLLQEAEQLHFVYGDIQPVDLEPSDEGNAVRGKTWLVGLGERLVAFMVAETPQLVWEGDRHVLFEGTGGYVRGGCRLVGGRWLNKTVNSIPTLLLRGPVFGSSDQHFSPLRKFRSGGGP